MAKALVLEFEGVGRDGYDAVNERLGGLDVSSPDADWPAGILSQMAGSTETGWVVIEVWESQEAQAAFMDGRLGRALHDAGMPAPTRITWMDVAADTRIG